MLSAESPGIGVVSGSSETVPSAALSGSTGFFDAMLSEGTSESMLPKPKLLPKLPVRAAGT